MKKSFILYTDTFDALEGFTDTELGKLFRLIYNYQRNPENPVGFSVSQKIQTAFAFFKAQFIRDNQKYLERSQIRSEVGKKGGLASAEKRWGKVVPAEVSKNKQLVTLVKEVSKVTPSDSDSDSDNKEKNSLKSSEHITQPVQSEKDKVAPVEYADDIFSDPKWIERPKQ